MKKLTIIIVIIGVIITSGYIIMRTSLHTVNPEPVPLPARAPEHRKDSNSILDIRPLVIRKLQELVKSGTDNLYNLYADSISLDITDSKAELYNLKLMPDEEVLKHKKDVHTAPDDIYRIGLSSLK